MMSSTQGHQVQGGVDKGLVFLTIYTKKKMIREVHIPNNFMLTS